MEKPSQQADILEFFIPLPWFFSNQILKYHTVQLQKNILLNFISQCFKTLRKFDDVYF